MALRNGEPDQVLGALYPFEDRHVDLSTGHQMHVIEAGKARLGRPTFLLLHGNPTWSFTYRNFMGPLSRLGRVVAVDHVGFGRSDHPEDPAYHTLDRHIRNLEEVAAKMRLRRVVPVMHDWGGPIGLGYATRRPKDIAGLVLLNTWAFTRRAPPRLPLAYRALRAPKVAEVLLARRNTSIDTFLPRLMRRGIAPEILEGYRHPFPTRASRVAIPAWVRMVPTKDDHPDWPTMTAVEESLPELDVPARILWADKDPAFGRRAARAFHQALPRAEEPRYLDAGHYLQEDVPGVLTSEIEGFARSL